MKYRFAAVKYINTRPFLYGFEQTGFTENIEMLLLPPSHCAEFLVQGKVDVALCPVGAIPKLKGYHILSEYCIGCVGPVRTVALYADKPLEELDEVQLDAQSRTSNLLVQVLLKKYMKMDLRIVPPSTNGVQSNTGTLSIGDRCFSFDKLYSYKYDLGELWMQYTGLPFVFACWLSTEPIPSGVTDALDRGCEAGINAISDLDFTGHPLGHEPIMDYLEHAIDYHFDRAKREALSLFLSDIRELSLVTPQL